MQAIGFAALLLPGMTEIDRESMSLVLERRTQGRLRGVAAPGGHHPGNDVAPWTAFKAQSPTQ